MESLTKQFEERIAEFLRRTQLTPVALDAGRAVFVYVDPGHETTTVLHSWGDAHCGLWQALGERGRSVEVVAVARTPQELERARTKLDNWVEASGPDAGAGEEIARIEQAILHGTRSGSSMSSEACRPLRNAASR